MNIEKNKLTKQIGLSSLLLASFIFQINEVEAQEYEIEQSASNNTIVKRFVNEVEVKDEYRLQDFHTESDVTVSEISDSGFKVDIEELEVLPVEKEENKIRTDNGFVIIEHVTDSSNQLNTLNERKDDFLKDQNLDDFKGFGVEYRKVDIYERPSDNIVVDNPFPEKELKIDDGTTPKSLYLIREDDGLKEIVKGDLGRDRIYSYRDALKIKHTQEEGHHFRTFTVPANIDFSNDNELNKIFNDKERLYSTVYNTKKKLLESALAYEHTVLLNIANNKFLEANKEINTDLERFDYQAAIPDSIMAEAKASKMRVDKIKSQLVNYSHYYNTGKIAEEVVYLYYAIESRYNSYKRGRIYNSIIFKEEEAPQKKQVIQLTEVIDRLPSKITQASAVYVFNSDSAMKKFNLKFTPAGIANRNYILLNKDTNFSYLENFTTHEIGHVMDFKINSLSNKEEFRKVWHEEINKKGILGSYAKTNLEEGWAESFRAYYSNFLQRKNSEKYRLSSYEKSIKNNSNKLLSVMNKLFFDKYKINAKPNYKTIYEFNNQQKFGTIKKTIENDKLKISFGVFSNNNNHMQILNYQRKELKNPNLPKGTIKIIQHGVNGEFGTKREYYLDKNKGRVSYKNVYSYRPAINEIVEKGTKQHHEIPFETKFISNDSMNLGMKKVKIEGVNGLRDLKNNIIKHPIDKVVEVGTKPTITRKEFDSHLVIIYRANATMNRDEKKEVINGSKGYYEILQTYKVDNKTGKTIKDKIIRGKYVKGEERVVEVGIKPLLKTKLKPLETIYEADYNLEKGKSYIFEQGKTGIIRIREDYILNNNGTTSKKEVIINESQSSNRIIKIGAKSKEVKRTINPIKVVYVRNYSMPGGEKKVVKEGEAELVVEKENYSVDRITGKITTNKVSEIITKGTPKVIQVGVNFVSKTTEVNLETKIIYDSSIPVGQTIVRDQGQPKRIWEQFSIKLNELTGEVSLIPYRKLTILSGRPKIIAINPLTKIP